MYAALMCRATCVRDASLPVHNSHFDTLLPLHMIFSEQKLNSETQIKSALVKTMSGYNTFCLLWCKVDKEYNTLNEKANFKAKT